MVTLLDRARELDTADPIAHYRERFDLPGGVVYLDGNSLGALPKATRERLAQVVDAEWGRDLIRSWNPTDNGGDWIALPGIADLRSRHIESSSAQRPGPG